jgi:hypothetical protein
VKVHIWLQVICSTRTNPHNQPLPIMAPKRKAKPPPSDDDTGSDYEESLGAPSDESDSDYEAEDEPTPKKKAPPKRGDLRPPRPCEVQQEPQTRL